MKRYNPSEIEPKWQKIWDDQQVYKADLNSDKKKYIAMSMFNYPSGSGIHIGHAMNYTISDVLARYKRQQGYESYHPVGWDAFGLPAENYAIKAGVSPQESMATIIPSYHKQYKAMGWSNDWSKEITTCTPDYYKWTQWIFTKMHENGLAYQDSRMQWWCDKCQTVLANEQVIDGKCWRHDSKDDPEVSRKEVKQWFFKVTEYADEMLEATADLDWSEVVKSAQINWIGKSLGAEVEFKVDGRSEIITVFTTRPDTLFGATFLVLAPEHELVDSLTIEGEKKSVSSYVKNSMRKSEVERLSENKDKTGVFTGSYAINPVNGEKIPIWVADYVLIGYGTGAIMAVPAHDERDYAFAKKYDLKIIEVIEPETGDPQENPEFRQSIVAIVRNPKTDKYLSINWGESAGGNLFIGGGCENNEDIVETAKREITEETGYKNVKLIDQTGSIHHNYFAHSKNVARRIEAHSMLFELVDEERIKEKLEEDEKGKFNVEWLSKGEVKERVKDELHALSFELLTECKCYHGEGVMANSDRFDGMSSSDMREEVVAWLEQEGTGRGKMTFKIRDWSVSRQRYWGAPIPIINCSKCGPVPVPEKDLPVILPELDDFKPSGDGRSALARAKDWIETTCPDCGGKAERETDTLDTYVCSSWYFLRYLDPFNEDKIFEEKIANKWMPIDFYNGGDHATAHMIYARFITRFFYKLGLLKDPEPFKRFLFNGKVTASDGQMFSKSKGNGVDPLEIISSGYGADALRVYLMFAAPLDQWIRWDPQGVPGAYRFLNRLWNLVQEFVNTTAETESSEAPLRVIHPTIKKVTADLEDQKYNTAIAAMMKATNDLYLIKANEGFKSHEVWQSTLSNLVSLVAPFAPHIADEMWDTLGNRNSVQRDSWPKWDKKYLSSDTMLIVVQVNGKLRAKLDVPTEANDEEIKQLALMNENVAKFVGNKEPTKVIYVPGRLVNIVVK